MSVGLSMDVVRALVPMLVMGSKEKNAAVKSYSEQALVCLLRLRQDDSMLNVCTCSRTSCVNSLVQNLFSVEL